MSETEDPSREDEPEPAREATEEQRHQVTQAAHRARDSKVTPLGQIPGDLDRKDRSQDIDLKKKYANALLAMLATQLVVANGVFIAYASWGRDWDIEASVMNVWLAATVVEIIGIVLIVTRYLFPNRDA